MQARRSLPHLAWIGLALLGVPSPVAAQAGFDIRPVFTQVGFPTTIRFAPDGRLFVTELTGRVSLWPSPSSQASITWTTLQAGLSGEDGVHGLAIHPDYPDSPYVYVAYNRAAPHAALLVRFRDYLGQATEPAILMEIPIGTPVHTGGRIEFGPDGMIYWTFGDQDNPNAAQDISTINGKVFRLGRAGQPAPANPWGPLNPAALLGIRNAFGLAFDPLTGIGYFTENGDACEDEVNLLSFGANYGWSSNDPCGSQPVGVPALASFTPTIAPTGCVVYRGGVYPAFYEGSLFFGSFNESRVYRMSFEPGRPDLVDTLEVFAQMAEPVLDVTVGPDGFLWVATTTNIWRIVYPAVLAAGPWGPDNGTSAVSLRATPNPFNGSAMLETSGATPGARLEVFDLAGRRVRHWDGPLGPATWWDGLDDAGGTAPAGVYLIRLSGPGFQVSRRLVRLGV